MTSCLKKKVNGGKTMEVMEKTVDEWKPALLPALESKVDELQLLGYSKTSIDDVWKCLVEKVWKGNPSKRLFEVTQDILHLNTNIYMSYLTVSAYQDNEDLMASIAALTGDTEE
ncbi:post-transcriptional regulator [Ornithinibacillus halophilus]|nr:post-transcriptional regulator [Ornithinibacillus halophilus]